MLANADASAREALKLMMGVPEMSREISGWIGRMADFFEETGFCVKDKENGQ